MLIWVGAIVLGVIVEIYFANRPKEFGSDIGGYAWYGPYGPFMYIFITYISIWCLGGALFYKDLIDDIDVDRKDPYLDGK
ncbi:MAG: hypothetical protein HZA24_10720 [Nitrospirae bacterium]|nr:hypothetical protein [Nitrospirota bacterium]